MFVSADRVLARPRFCQCRRHQGIRAQPYRRFRLRAGHFCGLLPVRLSQFRDHLHRRPGPGRDYFRIPGTRSTRPDPDLPAAVHRRHGQIGAAWSACVAARRHGGSDPGLGADSCCHHGHRRGVHGGADVAPVRAGSFGARPGGRGRGTDRLHDGHHRPGPERHQARDRLFHLQPTRLHVLRHRGVGLWRRHFPPHDPRLFQVATVPGLWIGNPRHVRRTGHAQNGWPLAADSPDLHGDVGGQFGARRHSLLRRLLFQGHHHRIGLGSAWCGGQFYLYPGRGGGLPHGLLQLPSAVHDLPRRIQGRREGHGPCARIAEGDDGAVGPAVGGRYFLRLSRL